MIINEKAMNMDFYDVHTHCVGMEKGGILIGLEGEPVYDGVYTNGDIEKISRSNKNYFPAYYITNKFNKVPCDKILKYHPRRENYLSIDVINDLANRQCRLCVLDTLYSPVWQPKDYYDVVHTYPEIKFILAHMGGYDILEFVKILEFNKNVYADFSLTQEYFGWCDDSRTKLRIVVDMVDYCLNNEKLRKRVLFGSDYPFYSQKKALERYIKFPHVKDIFVDNFFSLINHINN